MGGDGPDMPSAAEEAQAQIQVLREQARLDAERAKADKATADAEKADRIAKAQPKQQAAYDSAVSYGGQQVGARGLDQGLVDQYGVLDNYRGTLDRTRGTLGEENANPVFGENTAFSDALTTGTNTYRNDLRKQFNATASDNFDTDWVPDSADDAIIASILGQQRGDVLGQLDLAKKRGTLNDTGYSKALQKLEQQNAAGNSQAQTLGGGVLGGYRNSLRTNADNARAKIGQADFGNAFDVGGATSALTNLRNSISGKMDSDITGAISGTQFFDPSLILGYGASNQGAFNPSKPAIGGSGEGNPLLSAFVDQNGKKQAGNPLTGSTGTGAF